MKGVEFMWVAEGGREGVCVWRTKCDRTQKEGRLTEYVDECKLVPYLSVRACVWEQRSTHYASRGDLVSVHLRCVA